MATVNKDFKIKNGLIVEGSNATVNGFDILTKKTADQNYIIDLIGGSATPDNTPDTVVLRDESGNFAAGNITVNELTIDGAGSITNNADDFRIQTNEGGDFDVYADDVYFSAADDIRLEANDLLRLTSLNGGIHLDASNAYFGTFGDTSARIATEGYVDTAETDAVSAANAYTDGRETAITTAYESYADQAEVDAKAYTDTREGLITTAYQSYADTAESDAVTSANSYTDGRETAITTAYQSYADTAEADAVTTANAYTDTEIAALVDSAPALLDTLNELAAAIGDNPNYAVDLAASVGEKVAKAGDTMTGLLVLSADPSANLGAATKQYVDAAQSAAEDYADTGLGLKQDTLIAGSGLDVTGANIDVNSGEMVNKIITGVSGNSYGIIGNATYLKVTNPTGYHSELDVDVSALETKLTTDGFASQTDISDAIDAVDTDAVEEGATNLYFTDQRAKDAAIGLLTGPTAVLNNIQISTTGNGDITITAENGVADSDTDALEEGTTNLYFTDERAVDALEAVVPNFVELQVNTVAKQVAATLSAPTAGIQNAFVWSANSYKSAEFLVKVAYGAHTEISKVLLTLDTSNNIAITEYGVVGTNGSASSISATIQSAPVGDDVVLQVTTTNNNSTVTVMGTLLV